MINPVTDEYELNPQSRTLGFSYLMSIATPNQSDFGWKDMSWDRRLDVNDLLGNLLRIEIGFRICRNK